MTGTTEQQAAGAIQACRHPCEGLPPSYRAAFEQIAAGHDGRGLRPFALGRLYKKGLIDRTQDGGWHVPVAVHIAWCEWCAKNG